MHNPLVRWINRTYLASKIRELGLYVRLHAYEYIVGDYSKFIAIIMLEPFIEKVIIKIINYDENLLNKIISLIRNIDPKIKIEIVR